MTKENVDVSKLDFSSQSGFVGSLESFLDTDDVPNEDVSSEGLEKDVSEPVIEKEDDNGEDTNKVVEQIPSPEVNLNIFDDLSNNDSRDGSDKTYDNPYKNIVKGLIKNKVFSDFDVIETAEGDVPFEDVDIDEDTFKSILTAQIEQIKEEAAKGVTKDVSDFTKQLITIEKNGGNISQALETYRDYQEPLDNLDLTNELDQQKAIFLKYHSLMGMDKEATMDLIESFINKGKLEEEAHKADAEIKGAVKRQLDALQEQSEQTKAKRAEDLKVYRTKLGESLNSFDLNSNFKKKIVDLATKENEQGLYELDNLYYSLRNNPETAASLALFLVDKEEYGKQISKNQVRETQLDTFKKLKLVKRGNDNIKLETGKKETNNSRFVDVEDIFGR